MPNSDRERPPGGPKDGLSNGGPGAPSRSVIERLTLALLVAASVCILYVAVWLVMAFQFRGALESAVNGAPDGMPTVTYSDLELGGFPLRFRARMHAPALAWAPFGGTASLKAREAVAEVGVWNWRRISVSLVGPYRFSSTTAGVTRTSTSAGGAVRAELRTEDGRAVWGTLTLERLAFAATEPAAAEPAESVSVGAATLEAGLLPTDEPTRPAAAYGIRARVTDVLVPSVLALPFGRSIELIFLDARINGPVRDGRSPAALETWRDAGGTIDVDSLRLDHGPLRVQGEGTLALDADMQPIGAFTAQLRGFFDLVEALRAQGVVEARDAVMAKVVLGALAKRPDDGGPPVLNVPLTLQDRSLYVGPVRLTRFPPVRWPALMSDR
ncbi:MAG: DUF2125 domain-containing protein [Rhodospirillales bacterium]|nr:DUF2125 domain-containing protein [Rhodospirillales bacterium]